MKKRVYHLIALLVLTTALGAQAQSWKSYRTELVFGLGTNHFLGDLGGGAEEGSHFLSARDVDWAKTRPTALVGIRYKLLDRLAVRGQVGYARLSAADSESANWTRAMRDLSFRSNLWEFGAQMELSIINNYQGRSYLLTQGSTSRLNVYLLGGVSGIYFNPKAELDGEWHALQPLGTEGQGLTFNGEQMADPYSKFSVAFPVGLGFRYYITKRWALGLEIATRYTLTDYMDDVSGRYFDNDFLRAQRGDVAADLADRHLGGAELEALPGAPAGVGENIPAGIPFKNGSERAHNNYNDAYIFAIFTLTHTFQTTERGGPKFLQK